MITLKKAIIMLPLYILCMSFCKSRVYAVREIHSIFIIIFLVYFIYISHVNKHDQIHLCENM